MLTDTQIEWLAWRANWERKPVEYDKNRIVWIYPRGSHTTLAEKCQEECPHVYKDPAWVLRELERRELEIEWGYDEGVGVGHSELNSNCCGTFVFVPSGAAETLHEAVALAVCAEEGIE